MWTHLSSFQCVVAKPKQGCTQGVIVDKSTNGTKLTKEPKDPGKKDEKWIVGHNDIIYLTETPCYVFVYTEASRPKTRLTAEQALAHPWIQKDQKTYKEALAIMESVDMMARNKDEKEETTVDKAKSVPDVPQAKKRKQSESEEFEFAASSADENAPMNQPATKKKRCDNN